MKSWRKPLGIVAVIAVVAVAYFLGLSGHNGPDENTTAGLPPDPGYAARDAVVIETGYDGRERYRLNAKVIRQRIDSNVIDLESLEMDYHPGAQGDLPGEKPSKPASATNDVWHLRSDRGQVRADGDDVQLDGSVEVKGPAPGTGAPITLTTETMRINTPTEFIQTDAPVQLTWSGQKLNGRGMQADLKAGTLRLESDVHGEFSHR